MAHILLGWELGENRGHVRRLEAIAHALRAAGHRLSWGVLRLDLLDGVALPGEIAFQAPLWPGQHLEVALGRAAGEHRSYADTLRTLGLARPGAFAQLVRGWDAILAATRPDAVFADFAPALLAACRGRVPVATAGIGFVLPPTGLPHFPTFDRPGEASVGEADEDLLDVVNAALAATHRAPLPALPALFAADATIVASFRELDPYAAHRAERPAAPFLTDWSPPVDRPGDEVVAYLSERLTGDAALLDALDAIGLPSTVVAPGATPRRVGRHVTVSDAPLPFAAIARRARLVVSNGNTGFVSAAMLAGLPQATLPHDVQKVLVGRAVTTLKVGIDHPHDTVDWTAWSASVRALADDMGARRRAAALATRLIPRMHADPVTRTVASIERLAA